MENHLEGVCATVLPLLVDLHFLFYILLIATESFSWCFLIMQTIREPEDHVSLG